MSRLNPRDLIR